MRAVLCGYYGKGNGGDEALLASLLQMLPESVTPLVLSGNPAETQARYGVAACDRMSPRAVLQALRQSDLFIWGGGSLIQDATSIVSPLYYAGLMGLAQAMGLRTVAWAQGIGPLKQPFTRWLAHQAFRSCSAISVRDSGSAALVARWNLPFWQAPDPVWALQADPVPELEALPAPRIAVSLRPHPLLTPDLLEAIAQALGHLQADTGASILLIPFQPVQDRAIAEAIQPRLSGPSQILQIAHPQQLKGVFQSVNMAISMRYHGLIMAAAEGCRCFAISYDPKVDALMDELRLPGWHLQTMPKAPRALAQQWLHHYQEGPALSSEQLQTLTSQALTHRELLQKALAF